MIINFGYLNIMIISFLQSVITTSLTHSVTHENVRRSDTSVVYVRVL